MLPAAGLGGHGHALHLPVQHADDVLEGRRLALQGLAPLQQLGGLGGPQAWPAPLPGPLALAEEGLAAAGGGPGLQEDAQQQAQVFPEPLRLVLLLLLTLHLPGQEAALSPALGPPSPGRNQARSR